MLGGTYRILRQLDRGGMSRVFEAEHLRLHRPVAVKMLAEGSSNPEVLARFEQEAEIVSQLEHPHIVTVLDFATTERGEPYLVLELLHGETLAHRLDRRVRLPLEEAVDIAAQIASGLSAAHRAAIVHRDLKPANVFLSEAPGEPVFVKLLDFGVSKSLRSGRRLTRAFTIIGTPDYMAPEQAVGHADLVDARTDQYALALVSYEMLTGEQPFTHDDVAEVICRVFHHEPRRPSSIVPGIPRAVDAALARGLAKDPADRFQSVAEFARALTTAAGFRAATPFAVNGSAPQGVIRPLPLPICVAPTQRISEAAACSTLPAGGEGTAESVTDHINRARTALASGDVSAAAEYARAALDLSEGTGDLAAAALVQSSESLLAYVFIRRLGSPYRRLFPERALPARTVSRSPRDAFLLSRLEASMSVEEALDVSAMPQLETLRRLVQLVSSGAVRLE